MNFRYTAVFVLLLVNVVQKGSTFDKFDSDMGNELCEKWYRNLDGPIGYAFEGLKADNVTIASKMAENEETKTVIGRMLSRFQDVFEKQKELTEEEKDCKNDWSKKDVPRRLKFYGFGEFTEGEECTTKYDDSLSERVLANRQYIIDDIKKIDEREPDMKEVPSSYGQNWNNRAYINDMYPVTDESIVGIMKCNTYRALGFRVNNTWSLGVQIYKNRYYYHAGKWGRIWITEFITKNGSELSQLPIHHPTCTWNETEDKGTFVEFKTGTAVKERAVSVIRYNHYYNTIENIEKHASLKVALEKAERHKELLQDSYALSNIAILLLPGLLTLFPIGLFQDATLRTLIPFSIATDVISVLPIIIKGSETIHYGRKIYFGNEILFHGSTGTDDIAIVQLLPAKCEFKSRYLIFGIVLVCIGISLMILGLFLEYFSIKRVQQKKAENIDADEGQNFGLLWYWNKEGE